MPHMEPTKVMMLGGLSRVGQFQPRLRTSFINPPRTTPIEPQNLLRQSLLGGLGRTGRMFMRLGQVGEELVTGPTEDIVNQYLEGDLSPAGQTVPTPDAPIMNGGTATMPGGETLTLGYNEEGLPVTVMSNGAMSNGAMSNGAGAGFSIPVGGYRFGAGAMIGYGMLSLGSGILSAFHGYARDRGSWASAFGWFVLGSAFPVVTPAVAFFARPGFAQPRRARS